MSICVSCMREKGLNTVCQYCGYDESSPSIQDGNLLPIGTTINNRYQIGSPLGQGGFGITYIGYDKVLNERVAIKEYFPSGMVGRNSDRKGLTIYTQSTDEYDKGKTRFLQEARTLAKFSDHPCIVGVKDCFSENQTAYMVMEYLDGISLKEYLKRKGGKVPVGEALSILTPVMDALSAVHQEGIVHRDVSPDNIFITTDSRVRLIDFGAARQSVGGERSLSIMLKPGYAPEEQYRARGNQGPWTDVYALTATLYRMIVGKVPQDSLERVLDDNLEFPLEIPQNIRNAMQMGMAVRATERFSSIAQLRAALSGQTFVQNPNPVKTNTVTGATRQTKGFNYLIPLISVAICVVVCLLVVLFMLLNSGVGRQNNIVQNNEGTVNQPAPTPTPIPTPVFNLATASSIRNTDSEGGQYSVDSILDTNNFTKWVPRSKPGIGEWCMIYAPTDQYVSGIRILNGYHKDATTYFKNNRVKSCKIEFSTGDYFNYDLPDTMDFIDIPLMDTVQTSYVKLTINSIYKGSSWNDTAITYLGVY